MSSCVATIVALAVVLGPLDEARAQRGASAARGTVAQLAWLAGTWRGGDGPISFEERWTPPAGGAMLEHGHGAAAARTGLKPQKIFGCGAHSADLRRNVSRLQ